MTQHSFIAQGKRVLEIEAQALKEIDQYIDQHFNNACQLMFQCTGRIIVIGMGKSGHVGNKIAATLASTGTPAFFVHPGEASHGDLGMITRDDVVMCISNSGETSEVVSIIPVIKRIGAKMISLTGNPDSTMATLSDVHVCIKEGSPGTEVIALIARQTVELSGSLLVYFIFLQATNKLRPRILLHIIVLRMFR